MTEKLNDLKNQLAQTQQQVVAQKPVSEMNPKEKVSHYLTMMAPSISQVLPAHVTPERMTRIALNVIRSNPKLLECDINSLMGAVMESAKLGLEPGMLGQSYLIPFNNRKSGKVECQFIVGVRGLIDLLKRSGEVSTIEARTVFENDEFDYQYGLDDKLYHKPTLKDKGEPIAYYAVCKLKDGGSSFIVMGKDEMLQYRDKYAKSKNYGPWVDEFDAMARKTCLRQLIKYLPISVEKLSGLNNDEVSGSQIHQEVYNSQLVNDNIINVNENG